MRATRLLSSPPPALRARAETSPGRSAHLSVVDAVRERAAADPCVAEPPAVVSAVQPRHASHLVLIPSYNSGCLLIPTVRAAVAAWSPVWVVIDGSTDGSDRQLAAEFADDPRVRLLVLPDNRGKGAAVLHGLEQAHRAGFTHALTMDADGQHPADEITAFMDASLNNPDAMILGVPVFDSDAPALRVRGRRISNWWANLETHRQGIGDSLFGFRVYPVEPLVSIMHRHAWMRRFDFDVEAVVRLSWQGITPHNLPAPVRYPTAGDGGISHFQYVRDNILLTWMHMRLFATYVGRLARGKRAGQR